MKTIKTFGRVHELFPRRHVQNEDQDILRRYGIGHADVSRKGECTLCRIGPPNLSEVKQVFKEASQK